MNHQIIQIIADGLVAGVKLFSSHTANTTDDAVAKFMADHEAEAVSLVELLFAKIGAVPGVMQAGPPPSKSDIKKALKAACVEPCSDPKT